MILRPYQEKAKIDIQNFLQNTTHNKGILVSPVGTGKALYTGIIAGLTDKKCLVVQPSVELLEQNIDKARNFGLDPSIFSASKNSKEVSHLTYATKNSLKDVSLFKDVEIIIVDEAHNSLTNTLKNGHISRKGQFVQFIEAIQPKKIIGLTATPVQLVTTEIKMMNRSKRSFWYQSDIFHVTQINEIKDEYWAELEYKTVAVDNSKLQMGSGSDFTKGSILKNYEYNMSTQKILENYEILRSQGKQHILTFVPSIENGQELKRKNRDFEMISAKTPNKERAAIITAFKKGEIPNLINVIALTTGFDAPIIDAIIKARSTNSIGLNYQMDGRAVRPLIDKKGNITRTKKTILDLSGNFDRFGKIDGITFEKQDYTKGWGMWNDGRLMSGLVNYERDKVIAYYEKAKNKPSTTINITKEKQLAEEVEFNFGKHKGRKVADIIKTERSYISWMMRDITFSPFNKHIQVAVMELLSKEVFNSE